MRDLDRLTNLGFRIFGDSLAVSHRSTLLILLMIHFDEVDLPEVPHLNVC